MSGKDRMIKARCSLWRREKENNPALNYIAHRLVDKFRISRLIHVNTNSQNRAYYLKS